MKTQKNGHSIQRGIGDNKVKCSKNPENAYKP